MKKIIALILALAMVVTLAACGTDSTDKQETSTPDTSNTKTDTAPESTDTAETSSLKIGVILVGDENEAYTFAHIDGLKKAAENNGIPAQNIVWRYSIPEREPCYDNAVDLAEEGCNLIISNSYGHQAFMQRAAEEYPNVTFLAPTGDTAANSGLKNFKNAFTNVYEARYVSGVVAGMKLKELIDDGTIKPNQPLVATDNHYDENGNIKIGFIGAFPYAEIVSGYTSYFLGVKSVVENVSMTVTYTNSWSDIPAETVAANKLISEGCVILSSNSDSTATPAACQAAIENGYIAYDVGYCIDMTGVAPNAALTSAYMDWSVYYTYAIGCMLRGEEIMNDWCEGYNLDAVGITKLGVSCAPGTEEKVNEVIAAIKSGELQVFSTDSFTVNGEHIDSYKVDITGDFVPDEDAEAIWDGYFHESYFRSAPSFDIRIDNIIELN